MAKKKYSINWEDDDPVSFEVDSVQYESLEDVPDESDRLKLEAMMNATEDAEFDAEFEKIEKELQENQGTPIEKIILPIFTGVAILMLLIAAIASVSNIMKINREASAPGRVTDVKMERSYVNEEDRVIEEFYYPVVQFVAVSPTTYSPPKFTIVPASVALLPTRWQISRAISLVIG